MDHGSGRWRGRHHPGRGEHDHHRRVYACPGYDDVPDADLHLEHPGDQLARADRVPAADCRAVRSGRRPPPRSPYLRPCQRGTDPLAAPVLVLRASRGLHRRLAVLRHRVGDLPGVQPQAHIRLPHTGLRDRWHRDSIRGRVGAPYVRHRRGAAAVLLLHDLSHRGADGYQVLQLDRHHVEGAVDLRDPHAVRGRVLGHVPLRRVDRCLARLTAPGFPCDRLVFCCRTFSLRALRHHRLLDLRRGVLLVPEDDGPSARRAPGQVPLLADLHRLPLDIPGAALAG
ncbi:Uncharacterised protein [Mycobacteroides abscessus subsp. massiliense]|nr:Uncharacterised protein [Mycobacteroides abscessus subsp. massiliense]